MEQWRLFLAIVLSIFVFFLWEVFFASHPPAPPQAPDKPAETQKRPDEPASAAKPGTSGAELTQADQKIPEKAFKSVTVRSSLYTAEISERGAALTSFVLQNYRKNAGPNAPLKQLIPGENHAGTALVHLAGHDRKSWANARFTTNYSGDRLEIGNSRETLSFFWESPAGIVVEKQYTFFPESYRVSLKVLVRNLSDQPITGDLILTLQNPMDPDRSRFAFEGPFAYINQGLEEIDVSDIEDKDTYTGRIGWAGICDRYFMTVAVPAYDGESRFTLAHEPETDMVSVNYIQPIEKILAKTQDSADFSLYFGPKRMSTLREYDDNLQAALNFGFFDIIAKPCLWLMNFIHDHLFANYGVAIILLTILFKIIFWPLGSKSYRSMAEMKKLQPLMADIRKKYKDDKKRMNEEVMRLYKTYKVNPMSGCLPMVVQIPVFIAFYRMLYEAIELRHAPFMLWINDLSAPDRLFHFDINVPLMLPPYGIPVLTIIMGATMFLQQKLSPPPGDPAQAKFMMMMPLVLTVIFVNFPAGLVLYWLVNNVISIAQQYYITKKHV